MHVPRVQDYTWHKAGVLVEGGTREMYGQAPVPVLSLSFSIHSSPFIFPASFRLSVLAFYLALGNTHLLQEASLDLSYPQPQPQSLVLDLSSELIWLLDNAFALELPHIFI